MSDSSTIKGLNEIIYKYNRGFDYGNALWAKKAKGKLTLFAINNKCQKALVTYYLSSLKKVQEERKRVLGIIKKARKKFNIILTTKGKEAMTIPEWQMKGYNQALDDLRDKLELVEK